MVESGDGSIDGMSHASVQDPSSTGTRRLLIAGATGPLGHELLQRAFGMQRLGACEVLVREPMKVGVRGVTATVVPETDPSHWPVTPAHAGLILFEPPRDFHGRERAPTHPASRGSLPPEGAGLPWGGPAAGPGAIWVPTPEQLPALARWMRTCGVTTLAVVLPHARGRLPDALRHGLANLDEHAVASLGFDCVVFVRVPHAPQAAAGLDPLSTLADKMLSIFKYMVPSTEQPVRAARLAELIVAALELAPPGIHVSAPHHLWQSADADPQTAVRQWLRV